eukprot:CAMPEP_0168530554 /NCGR_PEP_ID=MMETSP0405-20121227/14755_1 /TAXON_ID=498012 /ORGANISM="Trichosphaerium sp, Strain Am-I-7 wt" /LENGTH=226 /DNA_ID=CAMNT_0008554855 /DNA_START=3 /DNA_END=683 /DNA_ORIENTATION=-
MRGRPPPVPNRPPRSPNTQQPSNESLGNLLGGIANLWTNNFTDGGFTAPQNHAQAVNEQQFRANTLINNANKASNVPGQTDNHLGVPQNAAQWIDLATEAALLPKVQLGHGIRNQAGGVSQNNRRGQTNQANAASEPNPFANAIAGMFMQGVANHLTEAGKNPEQLPESRKKRLLIALKNEPLQRWNLIKWAQSPAQAVALAQRLQKPIFVEIVVGRLADQNSNVC